MTDYAVVLTHNRPAELAATVAGISPQVDRVVVVDNASSPPVGQMGGNVEVVYEPEQPPNLGRFWNRQLDRLAAVEGPRPWNVAVLCDDVDVPPGWFEAVSTPMRAWDASAASTHSYEPVADAYLLKELHNTRDRMCPWAFVLPGEKGLRADEQFPWFYVDTDVDWQARLVGGTLVVPGPVATNRLVGDWTARKPELYQQALRDEVAFNRKWFG